MPVRGPHLSDAYQAGAVLHRLAPALMTDRESFAVRQSYAPGVYSSAAWPPDQPMCMRHELSYTRRLPGLVLFACLTAPDDRRAVEDYCRTAGIACAWQPDGSLRTRRRIEAATPSARTSSSTAHTVREPWQAGDLMLVDNVRTAHSREAFQGPREVLGAMAEALHPVQTPRTTGVSPGRPPPVPMQRSPSCPSRPPCRRSR